jgi:hypothetical protein
MYVCPSQKLAVVWTMIPTMAMDDVVLKVQAPRAPPTPE